MELELKHLAPYLPYDLMFYYEALDGTPALPWKLTSNTIEGAVFYQNKPILRPLSDLTKEIEVNGKKFIPLEVVLSISANEERALEIYGTIPDYWNHFTAIEPRYWDYWIVQKFLEWHFDVFGLIPQGLAYDINKIDK